MKKRKRNIDENLIPFEKSRRVIRLEQRGQGKRVPIGGLVTELLAIAAMLYCLCIYLFMGYGTKFFLIWGVMALFLGLWSFLLFHPKLLEHIPGWIRTGFRIVVVLLALLFCTVEIMIISRFAESAEPGAEYVIVLGAQWKNHGPSYVLQKRLDKAVQYLKESPDSYVIVSGGKGDNEPVSEAEGMAKYLEGAGVDESRIIKEASSVNTYENLKFSSEFLDKEKDRVVIITNNFHMFRALMIARKQGYAKVDGVSADSYPAMLPNNLLREFFGVLKDLTAGNM